MKKRILGLLILLLLIIIPSVNAAQISKNDVEARTYIIGKYMFTRNTNSNYNGVLTTKRIMLASRSVEGNSESDMIIYYKKADGTWIEALTNASINVPDYFDIEVVDIGTTMNNDVPTNLGIDYSINDVEARTYLVGEHIFTRNTNDVYDGILTTKKIMLASKTISGNSESDMIIYYKKPTGDWIEALSGAAITAPTTFKVVSIDLIPQVVDNDPPVCTFGNAPVVDVGSTATLTLTCTDDGTGIGTTALTASSFTLSNSNVSILNISTATVTNGRKYTITLSGSNNGTTTIGLKSGAVKDLANNANAAINTVVTSRKTLTATFNGNGGTGSTASISCKITNESGCSVSLPANNFTYSGWNFNGWGTTGSETSGQSVGASITLTENKTYYALWKKESKTYVLTLDPNGAGGNATTVSCQLPVVYNGAQQQSSCSVTLPSNSFTYSGWTFVGWESNPSATTGSTAGSTINLGSNMTYYAIWRKNVSITFNANGCTTSNTSANMMLYNGGTNGSVTVPSVSMNSGWTSLGASASASSTTSGVQMGSSMTVSGPSNATSMTYYYNCKKNPETYTLSFNPNGGTGSSSSVSCTLPTVYNGASQSNSCSVTLPSNSFTYAGWTFNGWGTSTTGTSGSNPGSVVTLTSNKTYYALWTKTVNVTFNANGCASSNVSSTLTLTNGATTGSITVPGATMKSGWTALGVNSNASATTGTSIGTSMAVSVPSTTTSLTYYYICEKNITRTLTYVANGGSGSTPASTCSFKGYNGNESGSCSVTLANNGFTRAGYKFNGWGTSASAESGTAAGVNISLSANTTRYATWKEVAYTVRIQALDLMNLSPDRKLVVYADGEEIEFAEIKDGNTVLCTGENPNVNVYEVEGLTTLKVVLLTGETVNATIVQ